MGLGRGRQPYCYQTDHTSLSGTNILLVQRDTNFIIIKKWITEDFQEELFAHSRRIREGKVIAQTSSSTTELRINDRNKDKMYLVRKKSPGRRLRIFA